MSSHTTAVWAHLWYLMGCTVGVENTEPFPESRKNKVILSMAN